MKANEFVKNFSFNEAKKAIENTAWCETAYCLRLGHGCFKSASDCCVDIADLKRLVESHELVGNFGGIKRAKRILKKSYKSFNTMVSVVWNDKPYQCTIEKLEKAILDVESCQ